MKAVDHLRGCQLAFELTDAAYDAGVDAALIITPYYARPTQEALYVWYKTVAEEYPELPIIAYNVPSRTAVEIAPETVARLHRDVPNFVGIKETTKDFEHFSRVIKAAGRDLLVWSGIELLCLPLLALGGTGFVSATANIDHVARVTFPEIDGREFHVREPELLGPACEGPDPRRAYQRLRGDAAHRRLIHVDQLRPVQQSHLACIGSLVML